MHQSHVHDGELFSPEPSLLRRLGEAIVSWAERRELAQAERAARRRGSPEDLPDHLRGDVGMPPLHKWPQLYLRW